MQFKHPEILYALFLLLIPIIVHLFQLRRFKKVDFTNVKFLKQVAQNTRKSSRLKKFLILCTRLFALAGLIIAFSQPFTSASSTKKDVIKNRYIYLDNSLSMQAKGPKGELFKRAIQDIIETNQSGKNINLITNDKFLKELSSKDLKNELLTLDYHPMSVDINTILFKIKNGHKNRSNSVNEIILISDFQHIDDIEIDSSTTYHFVKILPVRPSNISIDSVYIKDQNSENLTITTSVKSYNSNVENVNISLFNNTILQGKSNVSVKENDHSEVDFVIPNNNTFNGKLVLEDVNLPFDNSLYFTINKADKINVLAIGNDTDFLGRIYTKDEFNFLQYKADDLDYSILNEQDLIILNQLETIPNGLTTNLKEYLKNGLSLVIIPGIKSDYKTLFLNLNIGDFTENVVDELSITNINFSHPILKNVFEKQIKNFQYPNVKSYFKFNIPKSSSILEFENEQPFISQVPILEGNVFLFTAAIDNENSNFKNSPLIVPVFYNFGKQSYKHSELNYRIGDQNEIEVKTQLNKDDILKIENENGSFIPLQKIGNTSVKIDIQNQPLKDGFYALKNKETVLKNIAFNYHRKESDLTYSNLDSLVKNYSNVNYYSNTEEALMQVNNAGKINNLWQFFLITAILFLCIEMLILKFLKP